MSHPRFCMAQPRLIFIHCLYLAKLNPILRISVIAQVVERRNNDLEIAWQCWFEPAVRHYFSSNDVRLFAYVFTGGYPQVEWLKRNESNIVDWFQTRVLSLVYCICKLFKS